jgi:hypothetical protein
MSEVVLPIVYIGNINYYNVLLKNKENVVFDKHENYIKQSYHNRTQIYGANGKLSLIIPLEKRNKRTPLRDIKIAYDEAWQKVHWKSFASAYRSSPYFEFYEHEFEHFYLGEKYECLIDFSLALQKVILKILNTNLDVKYTDDYKLIKGLDYRRSIHPKIKPSEPYPKQTYIQVFDSKEGYIPNLSILDLIFNQGPNAISFIS